MSNASKHQDSPCKQAILEIISKYPKSDKKVIRTELREWMLEKQSNMSRQECMKLSEVLFSCMSSVKGMY